MTPASISGDSRTRARRLARDWRAWAVLALALYTLIGFIVVPLVAKHQIPKQIRARLACEATVESVRFNPYTFNTTVRGFALADRRGEPLASFHEAFVNFAPWPLVRKTVVLEEVRVLDPVVVVRMREDATMNLLDVVPAQPAAVELEKKEEEAGVVIRVDRVALAGGRVTWEDATTDPDASLAIDSLSVRIAGFRSVAGDTTFFETSFHGTAGGVAKAAGWVMPMPVDGVVHARVDADSLSLVPADPYLGRFAYLDIKSGKLAVHGDVHVVAAPEEVPVLEFAGDIVSDDLHLYDSLKGQDFFGFRRVSILQAKARSQPPSANVDEIAIDRIYARIAIAADQSFNVTDVFAPAMALADSAAKAKAVVSESDSTGTVTLRVPAGTKAPLPDIAIGRITIDGGEVDFSDLSLPLPFATRVHSVQGEVTALSPDNAAGSSVLVEGTVDEHGFAKATGYINAFDPVAFTDISVNFRNIELTDMTPYSGKFMGYRIKRGKLSLGLEYDIKQAQLKGDHQILLEKLTLGEKIESPDAVGLPIKLAIALLKDKNGNIDLDLEVEGDLNDPKVNTASLVWQALKKVIIKITTAPFRFLGNLLGIGGDEMEFVEFEAGSAALTPPQYERMGNLGKALAERPQLTLQVRGAYDTTRDAEAMRKQRFNALLTTRLVASANGDSAAARAIADDPSSGRMQAVLEALTAESFGPESIAAMKAENTKVPAQGGAAVLDPASYFQAMRERLTAEQKVAEAELVALSGKRAEAIRGYMSGTASIAAERVVVLEPDVSDNEGEWVRCRLGLEGAD
jgi:hypothetical protein